MSFAASCFGPRFPIEYQSARVHCVAVDSTAHAAHSIPNLPTCPRALARKKTCLDWILQSPEWNAVPEKVTDNLDACRFMIALADVLSFMHMVEF